MFTSEATVEITVPVLPFVDEEGELNDDPCDLTIRFWVTADVEPGDPSVGMAADLPNGVESIEVAFKVVGGGWASRVPTKEEDAIFWKWFDEKDANSCHGDLIEDLLNYDNFQGE